jgi:predicted nucleic acid-binding protein
MNDRRLIYIAAIGADMKIADFDQKAAWRFGEIRSALERAGKPIGSPGPIAL